MVMRLPRLGLTALFSLIMLSHVSTYAADERQSLTLVLKQLALIESTLARARMAANSDMEQRYFFDYPQITADIQIMRAGIAHYLGPERAQPRMPLQLHGDYRQQRQVP